MYICTLQQSSAAHINMSTNIKLPAFNAWIRTDTTAQACTTHPTKQAASMPQH
jgi:hypothetical protein